MAKQEEPPKAIKKLELDVEQITRAKSVLNQNQIQKIFNSTPAKFKYKRPAKGGGEWSYVRASYVRKVLDSVFGFNWDFEIETSLKEAYDIAIVTKVCVVKGILTGRVLVDGKWLDIKKTQFGRSEVKFKKGSDGRPSTEPLDYGNDMKAAASDCLKKCASLMGIAADIYESEEFMEIEVVGSDEQSARQKQLNKQIEKSKKVIGEMGKPVEGKSNGKDNAVS